MQKYSCLPCRQQRKERHINNGKHSPADSQHKKTKGLIIACGKEVQRVSRRDKGEENFANNPIVLARVAIDLSTLNKPLVKIDFSTMIQVVPTGVNAFGAQLFFQLVRNCRGEREVLNVYHYVAEIREMVSYNLRQSFSFTFCDDDIFCQRDCCVYTVELIDIVVIRTGTEQPVIELIIEDSAIRAIAQDICDGFQHEALKQPVCKDVALVCGKEKNTVVKSPVMSEDLRSDPIILAKLSFDMNCKHQPRAILYFSTLIQVEEAEEAGFTEGVQLSFLLKRNCSGVEEVLSGYEYIKYIDRAEISYTLKNAFNFNFCDDQLICAEGCCTYTVELVGIEILGTNSLINRLVIENSAINAILCD